MEHKTEDPDFQKQYTTDMSHPGNPDQPHANVSYVARYNAPPQYPPTYSSQMAGVTVVSQQPVAPPIPVANTVPDNMPLAIFTTFCCFWPVGIFAIMRASEARAALNSNNIPLATQKAAESKKLSMISLGAGIVTVIVIIIIVAVEVSTINNYRYRY